MAPARGKFITFEGGEGTGKSTQAKTLRAALEAAGISTILTREPGGSEGAEQIRKLLVEGEPERWSPLAETLLFMAARADHIAHSIEPALAAGKWVISDRFADSTFVYQGIARGLGIDAVRRLHQACFGDFAPDLTIILDLEPQLGLARAGSRIHVENRFERFDAEFHKKLRKGFLEIAAREPKRCTIIDGSQPIDDTAAGIWRIVKERLKP